MTTLQNSPAPNGVDKSPVQGALRRYLDGVQAVVGMELRQRLRSRGWYIMLGIWFAIIGLVTALTWIGWKAQGSYMDGGVRQGPGQVPPPPSPDEPDNPQGPGQV